VEYDRTTYSKPAHTGRPRSDDRMIINGIIYVLISGCRWSEMLKTILG